MARPKRQRDATTTAAAIELPPTTRRRRSSQTTEPDTTITTTGLGGVHQQQLNNASTDSGNVKSSNNTSNNKKDNNNTSSTSTKRKSTGTAAIPTTEAASVDDTIKSKVVVTTMNSKVTRSSQQQQIKSNKVALTTNKNDAATASAPNDIKDDQGNDHAVDPEVDEATKKIPQEATNQRKKSLEVSSKVTATIAISNTNSKHKDDIGSLNVVALPKHTTSASTASSTKKVHSTTSTYDDGTNNTTKAAASTASTTASKPTTIEASKTILSSTTTRRSSNIVHALSTSTVNSGGTTALKVTDRLAMTTNVERIPISTDESGKTTVVENREGVVASSIDASVAATDMEITATNNSHVTRNTYDINAIHAVLQHRKLLLQRIQQCKRVSNRRLLELLQQSNPNDVTVNSKDDDELETSLFHESMKNVLSMARKQARLIEQQQQVNGIGDGSTTTSITNNNSTAKATNVSLRRGNSVGKRMNAAISTLTGNNNSSSSNYNTNVSLNESSMMGGTTGNVPLRTGSGTGDVKLGTTMNNSKPVNSSGITIGQGINHIKSALPLKRPDSSMSRTVSKKSQSSRSDNSTFGQQQKNGNISQLQQLNTTTNTKNISGGIHHQQRIQQLQLEQQHNTIPKVVCPETMALRSRRDEIRIELSNILQNRSLRQQQKDSGDFKKISTSQHGNTADRRMSLVSNLSSSSLSPRSTVLSSKPSAAMATIHRTTSTRSANSKTGGKVSTVAMTNAIWDVPDAAPSMPPRRKTHWDIVLEEMRWMATDYMQEEKWKKAACKVLSKHASMDVLSRRQKKKGATTALDTNEVTIELVPDSETKDTKMKDTVMTPSFVGKVKSSFQPLTADDILSARSIAKEISIIISKMVSVVSSRGCGNISSALDFSIKPKIMKESDLVEKSNDGGALYGSNDDTIFNFKHQKRDFLNQASAYIDNINAVVAHDRISSESKCSKTLHDKNKLNDGPNLSTDQLNTVQIVEDRWKENAGSIVAGSRASGKTVIACSLLWRNRANGPQLLVCSSSSSHRWLHELGLFPKLRVTHLIASRTSDLLQVNFTETDVLVCHRADILNMCSSDFSKFTTIVLDCRYAGDLSHRSLLHSHTDDSICVPTYLSSYEWWNKIVRVVSSGNVGRRLLIEANNYDNKVLPYFRALPGKQFMEAMALRTAFLLGTQPFITPIYSISKAVLAWARHQIKKESTATSKFEQVSKLLMDISTKLCITNMKALSSFNCLDNPKVVWETRYCAMSQIQAATYNRVCRQSQLTLSRPLGSSSGSSLDDIAASLLLLRRHCTHSNIAMVLQKAKIFSDTNKIYESTAYSEKSFARGTRLNTSQVDLDLANEIISGSGKLLHLVSILIHESNYKLIGSLASKMLRLHNLNDSKVNKTNAYSNNQHKVAIVAALPEVQLLVSILLRAIGIKHEILLAHQSISGNNSEWINAQKVLSTFNCDSKTSVSVVITSLASVEGDHVGLGIEAADTIVILDEDWSGKEESRLHCVLSRCSIKRRSTGRGTVRVFRLVAESTCEEIFLCNGSSTGETKHLELDSFFKLSRTVLPQTFMNVGMSHSKDVIAKNESSNALENRFSFPGLSVFQHRDKALHEVLQTAGASSTCPHEMIFLPSSTEPDSVDLESQLLVNLMRAEEKARFCGNTAKEQGPISIALTSIYPPPYDEGEPMYEDNDNVPAHPLQIFVRKLHETVSMNENSMAPVLANVSSVSSGVITSPTTEHFERDARPLLVKSPCVAAVSLLFYSQKCDQIKADAAILCSQRTNSYSVTFSLLRAVACLHDGNQGAEALIYFPPIFPQLQECADRASAVVRAHWAQQGVGNSGEIMPPSVHDDNHINMPLPTDVTSKLVNLNDDFGLAGVGAFPSMRESTLSAGFTEVGCESAFKSISENEWFSVQQFIDADEYQKALLCKFDNSTTKSMILLVSRKRQRNQVGLSQIGRSVWNGMSSSISDVSIFRDVNGASKKWKKPISAFNKLPTTDHPQATRPLSLAINRKEDYRHRLLSALRQSGSGSTIFEAPTFRVATIRIRDKIVDRLITRNWDSSSARGADRSKSGLYLLPSEALRTSCSSIGCHQYDESTDLAIKTQSTAQQQMKAFRTSHIEPRRVDFGPFQLGFIYSLLGMTSITMPKARMGISLPLGVKVSLGASDDCVAWNPNMDRILAHSVDRFGINWSVASRLLKGFSGVSLCSQTESKLYLTHISNRLCKERWIHLSNLTVKPKIESQITPLIDQVTNNYEGRRVSKDNESGAQVEFLLPQSVDTALPVKSLHDSALDGQLLEKGGKLKSRRTFTAFKLGLAKQQYMPISTAGASEISPPCHPSHELTVQMSTMAVNGRTDMWPLQILDGADRIRATAAAAAATAPHTGTTGTHLDSTSSVNVPPATSARRIVSSSSNNRSHSSGARNGGQSSHRSHSTTVAQRPASSSAALGSQQRSFPQAASYSNKQASQNASSSHVATTSSKQSFVPPPMPPTKVIPVVQRPQQVVTTTSTSSARLQPLASAAVAQSSHPKPSNPGTGSQPTDQPSTNVKASSSSVKATGQLPRTAETTSNGTSTDSKNTGAAVTASKSPVSNPPVPSTSSNVDVVSQPKPVPLQPLCSSPTNPPVAAPTVTKTTTSTGALLSAPPIATLTSSTAVASPAVIEESIIPPISAITDTTTIKKPNINFVEESPPQTQNVAPVHALTSGPDAVQQPKESPHPATITTETTTDVATPLTATLPSTATATEADPPSSSTSS